MAAGRKPGVKAPFPGFIEPALATAVDTVPTGQRWVHEIKFDGYRVQVHLKDAAVKVFTRRGNDWTNRFQKIAAGAWHVDAGSAIMDGEVVVPAADGTTDFSVLQNELKGRSKKIVLVAFDLLYLNGYDLRTLPLFERKALLKKIIAGTDVKFSERVSRSMAGRVRASASTLRSTIARSLRRPSEIADLKWRHRTCRRASSIGGVNE